MKRSHTALLTLLLCFGLLGPAHAHVSLIYPKGGETLMPGTNVTIEWRVDIPHNQENWDLLYSSDGGTTWKPLSLDMPVEQLTYDWTVPAMESNAALIRIVQDNAGMDYDAISATFTINGVATSVDEPDPTPEAPTVFAAYPNPFTTTTTVAFTLPRAAHVSVEVFDVRGVKIETLLNRSLAAGDHRVAWTPTTRASGLYLYRVAVGDHVQTATVLLRH